ncbi:hypothetical protein GOP47_0017716 [Adiantum capillus-veneris]|uniref:Uncharacterized protein n=1 Tax=Adiantum capillus-veneris TaxID=13818 RepID=A0A9D4UGS0_ADICA|nr:hypothetical protein GOP47_0017716 [Adiantum capillus-veneris]
MVAYTSGIFVENNNIELEMKYPSQYGASIYRYANGNYYYRCGDASRIPPKRVEIYYNSTCYVDLNGVHYYTVEDPVSVDSFGKVIMTNEEVEVLEQPPILPID